MAPFFCLLCGRDAPTTAGGTRRYKIMTAPIFKRILLKLSGEALAATQGFGVDPFRIHEIAAELADVQVSGN